MTNEKDQESALPKFELFQGFLLRIIKNSSARNDSDLKVLANRLAIRIACIGESIMAVCRNELQERVVLQSGHYNKVYFDHSSIATLCRSHFETCIMLLYITDLALEEEEFNLRMLVLDLHDLTSRYRKLKDLGNQDKGALADIESERKELSRLKDARQATLSMLESNKRFLALSDEDKTKIRSGTMLFARGMRSAVKECGWDIDGYNLMQNFLSAYTHGSPSSFLRRDPTDRIPKNEESVLEQALSSDLAIDYCYPALDKVCNRMFHIHSDVFMQGEAKH